MWGGTWGVRFYEGVRARSSRVGGFRAEANLIYKHIYACALPRRRVKPCDACVFVAIARQV